jgi:hypothetical protein
MERKLIELTDINEYGQIGFKFADSKRFSSGKVETDKDGRQYFKNSGKKYYLDTVKVEK